MTEVRDEKGEFWLACVQVPAGRAKKELADSEVAEGATG